MWQGLFIDGTCQYVIRWDYSYKPTLFDFNVPIVGSSVYEIITVNVEVRF